MALQQRSPLSKPLENATVSFEANEALGAIALLAPH